MSKHTPVAKAINYTFEKDGRCMPSPDFSMTAGSALPTTPQNAP